jgi:hypothetical protein
LLLIDLALTGGLRDLEYINARAALISYVFAEMVAAAGVPPRHCPTTVMITATGDGR